MSRRSLTETLRETLAVFGRDGDPMTTTEVADRLDLGRRSTYDRLDRLVDDGHLETKKVGANARVWWRPRAPAGDDANQVLSRLIDTVPGMVYRCRNEPGWPMTFVSDAAEDITGHDPTALESGTVSFGDDVVHPDDRETLKNDVADQLERDDQFTVEYRIRTAEGETRHVRERGCAVDDEQTVLEGVITDVTDEVTSKQSLSKRGKQFSSLVDATTEYAIFLLDESGHVRTWNPGAERIKGYERDEIVGEHFSTFYTESDRAAGVPEENLATAESAGSAEDEGWRVRADGTEFWANVTITAIRDEGGTLEGFAKVTRDMTDRREREQRLREEKAFVESLFDTQRDLIYAFDTDGEFLRWNDRVRAVTGYSDDQLQAMHPLELVGEDATVTAAKSFASVIESGEYVSTELPLVTAEGETIPYEFTAAPLRNDAGDVVGVTGIGRDVTARKRKERELERQRDELEQELSEVFDRIDDAFMALDDEWQFVHVNDQAATLLERSVGDLIGRSVWDAFPETVDSTFQDEYERALETQESNTFEAFFTPLSTWFEVSVYPSESGLSVYFRDVTERKQREQELVQYETLMTESRDVNVVLDETGRYATVMPSMESELGYDPQELVGEDAFQFVHPDDRDEVAAEFAKLLEDPEYEPRVEYRFEHADGYWVYLESRGRNLLDDPDIQGIVVYSRDVTARKEREQELVQYETLMKESRDVNVILDEEGRFRYLTPSAKQEFGYEPDDLFGEVAFEYVHPDDREVAMREFTKMVEDPGYEPRVEVRFRHGDGHWIDVEARGRNLLDDPDIEGIVVYTRDVTARKQRERELELYETIVETVGDGIYVVDRDGYFTEVNEAYTAMVGRSREDLIGAHVCSVVEEDVLERAKELEESLAAGEQSTATLEAELAGPDGETRFGEATFALIRSDDDYQRVAVVRDVTERKRRERELEESRRRYQTLIEHFPNGAVTLVDEDLRYVTVGGTPLKEAGGATDEIEGRRIHEAVPEHLVEFLVSSYEAALEGETSTVERTVGDRSYQFRFLPVRDEDGDVFAAMGMSQDITDRLERERELRRQREQLAALNNLNEVVRGISDAVIDQSTREEIEATVCRHLAEAESYEFAWIGDVDVTDETVQVRAGAGVENYLDGITITVDPDDERSGGPTGRAFRTGQIQVTTDVGEGSSHDPWRNHVEQYEFNASAAIPIVHDGTIYGVLNVYTDRTNAFEDQERAVIGQLGEVVGHAIAATERKQALMSDELVELEFHIPDVFEVLGLDAETGGTVTLDQAIPLEDQTFLVYGTVDADARAAVSRLTETVPHWESIDFTDDEGDTDFELRVSEPPVLSVVASLGGSVERAVIEDGDYDMTIHVSPSVDVRKVIDAVEAAYPEAQLRKRRQVSRTDPAERFQRAVSADLTDRQRTALEAAYHAGFFEWPRDASGEDVAESLDIAAPTFHQHLRKAERKIFEQVLATAAPT